MKKSLFVAFIAAFQVIAASIEKRVNDKKTEQTYLFKDLLTKKQSTDLRWDSLTVNGTLVSADVVALSSSLPLKKRDKFSTASGEIPKIGMKMQMNEKQMSDVEILKSRGVAQTELVKLIFEDEVKCTMGIYEKLEYMFLQGLSSGVALVDDDTNVGTGIRVDYGYQDSNKFGVTVNWAQATAKPIDDIKRIMRTAMMKGDVLKFMFLDTETLDALCNNEQVRQQFAFSLNFVGNNIPTLDNEQIKTLFSNRLKLSIIEIDRYVMVERDAKQNAVKCWADNQVVFTTNNKVGDLVWGTLVEDLNRSKDVDYAKVDGFILLKKWHEPEPFAEFTSSQALVLPVINNVSSIYIIDCGDSVADVQTEGDANFSYKGTNYTKVSVVAAYKIVKPTSKITTSTADAYILEVINKLSDEEITIFEANIVAA
jgi:hypothetical protein